VPAIAVVAAIGGAIVALHYHRLGLTLSHYDARGHLVVARRVIDSITPGWQQIGAVWLPLPHLLNMLPAQIDLFYRTGASAVALSIASFAIATASIAWIAVLLTDSALAGIVGAAVFALNPNVLYLAATPMTEPMLLACILVAIALLLDHERAALRIGPGRAHRSAPPTFIGVAFALACLTRYEAWPVTAAALTAAVWARWRGGDAPGGALRDMARIAIYPAAAVLAFAAFSRVVVGRWFVSDDFFVPENKALGDAMLAAKEIAWGTRTVTGPLLVWIGVAGAVWLAAVGIARRKQAAALIAVSLAATAVVPWGAFLKGHPFRIRYLVPLVAIEAVGAAAIVGAGKRARVALAIGVLAVAGYELRPLDRSAPMVVEAEWDAPNWAERDRVTACLGAPGSGDKVMASMGSLGHYMQGASRQGFSLRDFLHEGNGDLWLAALDGPRPFARWILIEEKAQGGDMLALRVREHPHFLDGYARVCEGAGLALYARQNLTLSVKR
jgi:hypothetical protein